MKIKKRYKKFLKLWTEGIELERHQNSEFIEYRLDVLSGRKTIFIGEYDLTRCKFYCNPWLGRSRASKFVKVLMENGLKERVKVLVDEFEKAV
jgi:hypothetical protein